MSQPWPRSHLRARARTRRRLHPELCRGLRRSVPPTSAMLVLGCKRIAATAAQAGCAFRPFVSRPFVSRPSTDPHHQQRTDPYFVGHQFELDTQNTLRHFGFDLRACGKRNDKGIDLRGYWMFSPADTNVIKLPVIIQCKNEATRLSPKYVRELEGTVLRESEGTLGVLVSSRGFTPLSRQAFHSSPLPMALAVVVPDDEPALNSLQMNHAAQNLIPDLVISTLTLPAVHPSAIDAPKRAGVVVQYRGVDIFRPDPDPDPESN
ncbi:uncharacterized protein BJ171DRAFT_522896 [Polychytrium aggregatum]|uniref:uncharacterized protein n=1 Tax=Polychytrium aggregatum TaxID=110093 RepID=UPI0022FE76AA|nr:uncharacterized protein BJ171DRAFT_522896 [Polychytrium aggregatum]KAI9197160.1 hypothetical protein BJ171DRAFT_522896 [Polychytrium aggregatum]